MWVGVNKTDSPQTFSHTVCKIQTVGDVSCAMMSVMSGRHKVRKHTESRAQQSVSQPFPVMAMSDSSIQMWVSGITSINNNAESMSVIEKKTKKTSPIKALWLLLLLLCLTKLTSWLQEIWDVLRTEDWWLALHRVLPRIPPIND